MECAFLKREDSQYKYVAPFMVHGTNQGFTEVTMKAQSTHCLQERVVATCCMKLAKIYVLKEALIPLPYPQLTNMTVCSYKIILLHATALLEMADEYQYGQLSGGPFWIIMVYEWEYVLFIGW